MHIVFHRRKKSFLIIEMKLLHFITLQKNTEKTILLYITGSQPLVRRPVPVRNNLFQFYTLKKRYQFRIKTVSKEYQQ